MLKTALDVTSLTLLRRKDWVQILNVDEMTAQEIYCEIDYHLMNDTAPSEYIIYLSDSGKLSVYPFNLLEIMQNTEQSPKHHPEGSVWNHTMLVVDEAAQRKSYSNDQRAFMWAALLHDIGKPKATKNRKGKITAYDHDKIGAEIAKEFLLALDEEQPFVSSVYNLVYYHMQILYVVKGLPYARIEEMLKSTDIDDIALLGLCDRLGRTGSNKSAEEENISKFLEICKKYRKE